MQDWTPLGVDPLLAPGSSFLAVSDWVVSGGASSDGPVMSAAESLETSGPSPGHDDLCALDGPLPTAVLRNYSFIADGERGAVIDQEGSVAWMCFPRWSDAAVFAGLLGSGGRFRVAPAERCVPNGHYEDGTLIWHGRWVTERGIIESRDAMAYPGDTHRAILLRRITAVDQPGRIQVALEPAADYGRKPIKSWDRQEEAWVARLGSLTLRLSGAPEAVLERGSGGPLRLVLILELGTGHHRDLVLELVDGSAESLPIPAAEECWRRTEAHWRAAVPACAGMVASEDVRRGFAVLRGLTSSDGGTVAAATTSLPERAEAGRNYDYRYCWMRDTCYIGHAGAVVEGGERVLDDAVRWVIERLLSDGASTQPAYLGDGSTIPDAQPLDLVGYPGGCNVVGNRVRHQFQLDVFGEALLLLARAASLDRLDADGWLAAATAAKAIESRWTEADSGIWEIRPDRWTHSRLISVAGLKAISSVPGAPASWANGGLPLAEHILSETTRSGRHPSGRWQRAPDDGRTDASLLLSEIRGAVAPWDQRSVLTRHSVVEDLSRGGYVYRYGHPGRALGEVEGAFLVCNFWMALACLLSGEPVEGVRWFERGRAACGSPGLYSEEFDVKQHALRGNLPQAFVHALFIECAAAQHEFC